MSVALNLLVQRVVADVPARDGIPSLEQAQIAVVNAARALGWRQSLVRYSTIAVVSGTATYSLPADFVELIQLDSPVSASGSVIVSGAGLIPVPQSWQETYAIANRQITFYPTPQYTLVRNIEYKAGYVLDASNVYTNMDEDAEEPIVHKACAECLYLQANKAAADAWQYQVGDERVSKEKLASELRAQAQALEKKFEAAIAGGIGQVGMRATYPSGSYQ